MAHSPTLEQVGGIWAKVLGVKNISPEDNFFALGGHSLLGVKLISAIQEKMGIGDELKLSDLFEFPTLQSFSDHLDSLMAPSAEWGKI